MECAERGDNVGLDQFKSEQDFQLLLDSSEVFAVRSHGTGRTQAFIVIQPCFLTRLESCQQLTKTKTKKT